MNKLQIASSTAILALAIAWLGVSIQPPNSDGIRGALVNGVTLGGPAAIAGVQQGDVIIAVNAQEIADDRDLRLKIAEMTPGSETRLTVLRNGAKRNILVKLAEAPTAKQQKGG